MSEYQIYYATNRNHIGKDRWHPDAYGTKFSNDGMENLRFGVVTVSADESEVARHLNADMESCGKGNGEELANYLSKCANSAKIDAYKEEIGNQIAEAAQKKVKLGSQAMFAEVQSVMENSSDVLVYIHGFNVSWSEAVGSALALQLMLKHAPTRDPNQDTCIILFTWPSDGMALPWVSYKSDRSEATGSGAAVGRALLKLRDFLANLRDRAKSGGRELCGQDIHLLCHSMGNFLLANALARLYDFTPGNTLPRMFEHVFLCAADVDDNALESGQALEKINQIARHVSVYYNREDKAMWVSDYTKGNPERLGHTGTAHPALLHNKIHQIDCTPVIKGFVEHSYYLAGNISADIRASIDGWAQDDTRRKRTRNATLNNVWAMQGGD